MIQPNSTKVKIVATLGPSTDTVKNINKIIQAGVRIVRINFSHVSSYKDAKKLVDNVRIVEKTTKRPIAILGDLAGPKIRIGNIDGNPELKSNKIFIFHTKKITGTNEATSLNYPKVLENLKIGSEIYLGDGDIKLSVISKSRDEVRARVQVGGILRSRMGFSAIGIKRPTLSLQKKDIADIKTLVSLGIDALAISFVEDENDIHQVRKLLPKNNPPLIFAKTETENSVKNAESIIDAADGLLIARGDLGFSVPIAELPFIQKKLINLGLEKSKPVITATQMLESMIKSPYPTRAEVTDVAKAILDGSDCVMLSGETANGKFPEETVKMMSHIIRRAEKEIVNPLKFPKAKSVADTVSASAIQATEQVDGKLIVVFTDSGSTARRLARHRATYPIIALTPNKITFRQLRFTWGVFPYLINKTQNFDTILVEARKFAMSNGICKLKSGDLYVISAGLPLGKPGTTNLLLVQKI